MKLKLHIVFAWFTMTLNANAQTDRYWSGGSSLSDNFSEAYNWFGVNAPSSGDNLYFNNTTGIRHYVYSNYSTGSYFSNFITYDGAGGIKLYGDNTYAKKFENNNDENLLELSPSSASSGSREIGNRIDNDLEINPVGSGGILVSCDKISLDNLNGTRSLKVYGTNILTINSAIYEKNGSGSTLQLLSAATIDLKGNSFFTGLTTVTAGILKLNASGGALKSGNAVSIKGGILRVMQSQTIGNLSLYSGTLQVDAGVTLTITGTYTATGGTIDNKGTIKFSGASVTFPGNASVNNGVANTLTNIEAASSANLILNKSIDVTGTIFVSDNAIFDTSNHSVGGTGTNLTMTGTTKYKTKGYGSKPDASGSYSLAPTTTIEFYGTSGTDIRYGSPPIYYANIIVNGSNISNAGTANGIRFQTAGTFVVKNGATFNINTTAGFTGGTNTGINTITNGGPIITLETGSTIEYAKTGDQTITPFSPAYSNLTISGSGIKTTTATTINVGNDLNITASQLTIKAAQNFVVTNKVNNSGGTVIIENNGSLAQINDNAVNTGNITYQRRSNSDRNTDYTYWSTPVSSSQTLFNLFPETLDGMYYSYEVTSSSEDWKKETSATTMDVGKGYIVRGPEPNPPFPPSFPTASFLGTPNNGIIKISGVFQNKSYLLGNPYPSALNADKFLAANSGVLDGTLYFWTHNTEIKDRNNFTITDPMTGITTTTAGSGSYAYTSNDYASYNGVGGVAASGGTIPSGNITTAQGFFASSNTAIIGTNEIIFDNSMRVDNSGNIMNNNQFFKTISPKTKLLNIEKHRIWLNLKNSQGAFKQTLVGYITNATNEYDSRFDGESFDANEFVDFYSLNQDKNLVIQGRALPFDENDEVPLGFRTTIEGTFTINIDQVDGVLTNQAVFIEDKLTNTMFDLKTGNYTFNTVAGTFNDRFILRYTNKTLGTYDFETQESQVLVSNINKQLKINSAVETIDKVLVYDLLGRQLFKKEKVNSNELTLTNLILSQQTLLVKVTLENGKTVTRKVMY
jgi:hypothetical protein